MRLTPENYTAKQIARKILISGKSDPKNRVSENVLSKKGYYLQKVVKPLIIRSKDNRHYIYCNLFGVQHNLMERTRNYRMDKSLKAYNKRRNRLITELKVPIGTKDPRFKEYLKKGTESLFLTLKAEYPNGDLIAEFNQTGACKINAALLSNKWNHLYSIKQDTVFRLVKLLKKDSNKQVIKATISKEQAADLIARMGLKPYGEASGTAWTRPRDVRFWAEYRKSKLE